MVQIAFGSGNETRIRGYSPLTQRTPGGMSCEKREIPITIVQKKLKFRFYLQSHFGFANFDTIP